MQQFRKIPYVTAELYFLTFTIEYCVNSFTIPKIILDHSCYSFYNTSICDQKALNLWDKESTAVHDMAAQYSMYNQISSCVIAMVTLVFWGSMADRIGKRTVMIIPPLLLILQNIIYAILTKTKAHPKYFIPAGAIKGLYGDFSGVTMLVASYMATSTRRSTRTLRLSIVEGCIYLSFIPSVLIAGTLSFYAGSYSPYLLNVFFGISAFLYTIFFLPPPSHLAAENIDDDHAEKIAKDPNASFCEILRRSLLSVRDVFARIQEKGWLAFFLATLLMASTLFIIATNCEIDIATLFYRGKPYNFSSLSLALILCTSGLVRGTGLIITTQICIRYFKASDLQLVLIGGISKVISSAAIAFSTSQYAAWIITIFTWPISLSVPALRSLLSKLVDESHHGTVLSLFAMVDTIAAFIGSVMINSIYRLSLTSFHGLPYVAVSIMSLLASVVSLVLYLRYDDVAVEQSKDVDIENESNEFLLDNDENY